MIENPLCYPPPYEKLCGNLDALYSRRINRQHRIIYEIDDKKHEIHIIKMRTRYD